MKNIIIILSLIPLLFSAKLKDIVLSGYEHDKFVTEPKDIYKEFRAYVVSFDSDDDGIATGIPEWVSYEIRYKEKPSLKVKRPSKWITDKSLYKQKIAPNDSSYAYSRVFRANNPFSDELGYDRGHMCMKLIANRLGENADWNTHTVLNAVPQKHEMNAGIWLNLEYLTMKWADKYGKVWVICGPIEKSSSSRRMF
jgi:DNA/RNA endonuclease G (NUC1)